MWLSLFVSPKITLWLTSDTKQKCTVRQVYQWRRIFLLLSLSKPFFRACTKTNTPCYSSISSTYEHLLFETSVCSIQQVFLQSQENLGFSVSRDFSSKCALGEKKVLLAFIMSSLKYHFLSFPQSLPYKCTQLMMFKCCIFQQFLDNSILILVAKIWQMPFALRYQPTQRGRLRTDRSSALCFNTNPHKPHIFWTLSGHAFSWFPLKGKKL